MRNSLRAHFGRALKKIRTSKAITQQELADRAHMSLDYISKIERGLSSPAFEKIERLADALEVHAGDIFLAGSLLSDDPDFTADTYREIFRNTPDPLLLWTVNSHNVPGHILDANPAACELTGYDPEELRQLTPVDLVQASERGLARTRIRNQSEPLAHNLRYTCKPKEGEPVPVEASTKYFTLGRLHVGLTEAHPLPPEHHDVSAAERRALSLCLSRNKCLEFFPNLIIHPLREAHELLSHAQTDSPEVLARCRQTLDTTINRMENLQALSGLLQSSPGLVRQQNPADTLRAALRRFASMHPRQQVSSHISEHLPGHLSLPAPHLQYALTELMNMLANSRCNELCISMGLHTAEEPPQDSWVTCDIEALDCRMSEERFRAMLDSVNRSCKDCKSGPPKSDVSICMVHSLIQMLGGTISFRREDQRTLRAMISIPTQQPQFD